MRVNWFTDERQLHIARVGAALSVNGALLFALRQEPGQLVASEKIWAVVAALAAWLLLECRLFPWKGSSHPHDEVITRKLFGQVTARYVVKMRTQDFGFSFRTELLSPIDWLSAECDSVDWRFEDRVIQKRFAEVRKVARTLIRKISEQSYGVGHSERFTSIVPDDERQEDQFSKQTIEFVECVNILANEFGAKWDNLLIALRSRLPNIFRVDLDEYDFRKVQY